MLIKGYKLKDTLCVDEIISLYKLTFGIFTRTIGEAHDYPEIIYVMNGETHMIVDGTPLSVHTGEMLMYAPNAYHIGNGSGSYANVLIISFRSDSKKLKAHYNKVIKLDSRMQNDFLDLMDSAINSFVYEFSPNGKRSLVAKEGIKPYETEIIKKKLEVFLLSLGTSEKKKKSSNSKHQEELLVVIHNLNSHIKENLSLADMAELNAMSESKLKLLFREQLNTSPLAYFQQLKLEEAKRLLHNFNLSITEISEELGFASIHYFSRFFKKHIGASPKEYISAIKNTGYATFANEKEL